MVIAVQPLRAIWRAEARTSRDDADHDAVDISHADGGTAMEDEQIESAAGERAEALLKDTSLARELAAGVDAYDTTVAEPAGGRSAGSSDQPVTAGLARPIDDPSADEPDEPADAVAAFDMPDDPEELAELSRSRLAASDIELAHAAASHLEAVAPGTLEAHRALGAVALAEQDHEQAQFHYRSVLELEPLDQEAHERLALVSASIGRSTPRFPLRGFRSRR
jgi:tetratricopeptide (TPR) repeat protein